MDCVKNPATNISSYFCPNYVQEFGLWPPPWPTPLLVYLSTLCLSLTMCAAVPFFAISAALFHFPFSLNSVLDVHRRGGGEDKLWRSSIQQSLQPLQPLQPLQRPPSHECFLPSAITTTISHYTVLPV